MTITAIPGRVQQTPLYGSLKIINLLGNKEESESKNTLDLSDNR